MSNFQLSTTSRKNMYGCHPDVIRLVNRAIEITPYDFGINSSTVRSVAEQMKLVADGKSKTMSSRHIPANNECNLSCAVDINVYVNGKITWDIGYFRKVNQAFVTAAIELGIQIELGCLWRTFVDGPHIQLSKKVYP